MQRGRMRGKPASAPDRTAPRVSPPARRRGRLIHGRPRATDGKPQPGEVPRQVAAYGWVAGNRHIRSPGMSPSLLSQRDAALACGVSRSTIRRRREEGSFPNAVLDREHGWQIPTDDLRAAGLLNSPAVPAGQIEAEAVMPDSQDTSVLERQLVEERHSRELAQAEASRLRVLLDLQNQHLTGRCQVAGVAGELGCAGGVFGCSGPSWSGGCGLAGDGFPGAESFGHLGAVATGCEQMPSGAEVRGDPGEGGEEPLSSSR